MRSLGSVNVESERKVVVRVAGSASVVLVALGAALAQEEIAAIPFESVPGETTFVGGSSPIVLDSDVQVTGTVGHKGVYQLGTNTPTTYDVTVQRFVVEVPAENFGVVIPLDHARVESLCRDIDGCEVALQMLNWQPANPTGEVASRTARLFLSQGAAAVWRFSDTDVSGLDGGDGVDEFVAWDCYFGDGETYGGSANSRLDSGPGFGLLTVLGGSFPSEHKVCRVAITD